MSVLEWKLLRQADYVTTGWSGGTTTQLAIEPEGAVYAGRDFLWRLSSARVEADHSDFTPLPDYSRLISILDGELDMRIGDGDKFPLEPLQVCSFDGGAPVESWGRCTDFNLMLRKGACEGLVQGLGLPPASGVAWAPPVPAPQIFPKLTLAIYCASGSISVLDSGLTARAGELLLCRRGENCPVPLTSLDGAALLAAAIYTR